MFGDEDVFRKISYSLVLTSAVTMVDGETRLENEQGTIIGDTMTMPPGSVGKRPFCVLLQNLVSL